jgi:hypothetical protein
MDEESYYCETHKLPGPMHEDSVLGPHCPYCEEERIVESMRVHEMTRDPMVEPW